MTDDEKRQLAFELVPGCLATVALNCELNGLSDREMGFILASMYAKMLATAYKPEGWGDLLRSVRAMAQNYLDIDETNKATPPELRDCVGRC